MREMFEDCGLEKEKDGLLEHFKDHVATYKEVDGMQLLTFGKPDTCMGRMSYIFKDGRMIVTGDYGDCIYWWSGRASLQFVSGCHIHYVFGKVSAHSNDMTGNDCGKYDWSEDEARDEIKEFFAGLKDEEYDRTEEELEELNELEERLNSHSDSRDGFIYILQEIDADIEKYHCDFWESSLWTCGQVIPKRNKYHLLGVKLSYEQLKEKGEME